MTDERLTVSDKMALVVLIPLFLSVGILIGRSGIWRPPSWVSDAIWVSSAVLGALWLLGRFHGRHRH